MSFADYSDPTTPYMLRCHVLENEDDGMMAQFTVVEPADLDTAPSRIDAHTHHWRG